MELGLYITDFKPDLEGVDCADVVIYYNDPDAIALIGKKPGDVIISDEQKTIVLGIRDKSNEIDESFFGLIEMKDKKSIDFYLGWKNYDILKVFTIGNIVCFITNSQLQELISKTEIFLLKSLKK